MTLVQIPGSGVWLDLRQVKTLMDLTVGVEHYHWHLNDCGCCVTPFA